MALQRGESAHKTTTSPLEGVGVGGPAVGVVADFKTPYSTVKTLSDGAVVAAGVVLTSAGATFVADDIGSILIIPRGPNRGARPIIARTGTTLTVAAADAFPATEGTIEYFAGGEDVIIPDLKRIEEVEIEGTPVVITALRQVFELAASAVNLGVLATGFGYAKLRMNLGTTGAQAASGAVVPSVPNVRMTATGFSPPE